MCLFTPTLLVDNLLTPAHCPARHYSLYFVLISWPLSLFAQSREPFDGPSISVVRTSLRLFVYDLQQNGGVKTLGEAVSGFCQQTIPQKPLTDDSSEKKANRRFF